MKENYPSSDVIIVNLLYSDSGIGYLSLSSELEPILQNYHFSDIKKSLGIIIETMMTLSEEELNNKQAAEYYKQKIQINDSSDPYPDKKRNIADLYFLLAHNYFLRSDYLIQVYLVSFL